MRRTIPHKWHGFYHAGKALQNAMEDFALSEIEKETIRRHMFPLNPIPPRCRGGMDRDTGG